MVASLVIPQCDDVALTTQVVAERAGGKHKIYFANYLTSWLARIQEYNANQGDPCTIKPSSIPQDESGRFINLYGSQDDKNSQWPVIKNLRDNKLLFCPHLLKLASEMREDGESITQLIPSFLRIESQKTINSWPAVFYRSVMMDKLLMQHLESGPLPDYI